MDFVLFMVFALIENLGMLTLIFALYRLNLKKYWFPALVISIIMHLVNFYIRNEYLTAYTPVIVLTFIILLLTVVRIPLTWAIVVAITGYIAFNLLQGTLVLLSSLLHFLPLGQIEDSGWRVNVLQLITGVLSFIIGRYLYRRGMGYAFPFERLQFRLGTIGLVIMLSIVAIVSSATLYFNNLYLVMGILLIGFISLIYWAQRKEKEDGDDIL
ncbi:hypothetical protein PAECIP111893_03589 [Paenibacillus plantiphilus]|uniref:Uncharacterized protein n=1 Tax=Paenibacillus plantiphilus TaxID=2905650 RepID=A0ABN8GPP5_9BACL|nr:hypothetical protein [Paenibacillus plantiphilus]CAH1212725.1 hypothetical protein PAECIP111893_03589 [Paenibacillus plantiphilus]